MNHHETNEHSPLEQQQQPQPLEPNPQPELHPEDAEPHHPEDAPPNSASSPRRIAASRANGAKSHGPTTPEGLAACQLAGAKANFKHGLLSATLLIEGESRERFAQIVDDLIAEYQPSTRAEFICLEKMAASYWRQCRVWYFQTTELRRDQSCQDAQYPPSYRASLAFRKQCGENVQASAHRYETSYDRQFRSAEAHLRRLQTGGNRNIKLPRDFSFNAGGTWKDEPPVTDIDFAKGS